MKILVLGAGAVGGYMGGRLAQAGADVTFLVREGRRAQLERDGLRIVSRFGDWTGKVRTAGAGEVETAFDLVLIMCKAYDLDSAIAAVRPALAPDGMVIPGLNGIAHLDTLNAAFGRERVFGGTVKCSVAMLADGTIRHNNDWHWLRFGEQAGGISARARAVRDACAGATGFEAVPLDDIMHEMWEKLVHLATAAGMTCLMRANSGQIARAAGGRELFLRFLDASREVARRCGHEPTPEFLATYSELFTDPAAGYVPSMLRDIERGGPTEGDHIVGFMLRKARETGADDTLFSIAYTHLMAYEERRKAGGLG